MLGSIQIVIIKRTSMLFLGICGVQTKAKWFNALSTPEKVIALVEQVLY